jgi:hypothetical protein
MRLWVVRREGCVIEKVALRDGSYRCPKLCLIICSREASFDCCESERETKLSWEKTGALFLPGVDWMKSDKCLFIVLTGTLAI